MQLLHGHIEAVGVDGAAGIEGFSEDEGTDDGLPVGLYGTAWGRGGGRGGGDRFPREEGEPGGTGVEAGAPVVGRVDEGHCLHLHDLLTGYNESNTSYKGILCRHGFDTDASMYS